MDLTQMMAWIVAANTIITFATTIYNLMSTRATKALEAIKGLEGKIASLAENRQVASEAMVARFHLIEARMVQIESDLKHLPDRDQQQSSQDQAHRLEIAIEKLAGRMETLDERLTGRMDTLDERIKPLAAATARIQNLLVEQGTHK